MTVNKLLAALVGALFFGLEEYFNDNVLTGAEWVLIISMLIAAVATWLVPNTPRLATAKTWAEALVVGAGVLVPLMADGLQQQDLWPAGLAVLTAAGVYFVPNRPQAVRGEVG